MKNLKKYLISTLIITLFTSFQAQGETQDLNSRIEKLESELMDLKIKSAQSFLLWSGDFMSSYDNWETHGASTDPKNRSTRSFYSRLRLHNKANISNHIRFFSTLEGSYYANSGLASAPVAFYSTRERAYGDKLVISRAFFDYALVENTLSISVGRLPTTMGPPMHLVSNQDRQGTYPSMAYSVPLDGMALSYLNNWSRGDYAFRIIYVPINPFTGDNGVESVKGGTQTAGGARGTILKSTDSIHLMAEGNFQTPVAKNIALIFQAYQATLGRMSPVEARGVLDSQIAGDRNVYELTGSSEKMTTINALNYYLELENPFNFNLNLYSNYKHTTLKRRGTIKATIIEDNMSSAAGPVGTRLDLGGFLAKDGDIDGHSLLVGARYNFSKIWSLGGEFLNSSAGSAPTTLYSFHPTDFYNTIGEGFHLYTNHQINKANLNLTLGYSNMLRDHFYNGFNYTRNDARVQNIYLLGMITF